MIVTIDGIAASGKSSVATKVAQELGLPFVSSGLLYRAVTYLALQHGVDPESEDELLKMLGGLTLELRPSVNGNEVWCGTQELTSDLHTAEVDAAVSSVASHLKLRAWIDVQLRALPRPFVAEGRDMGTNVFPEAEAKFYLVASAAVRAERRVQDRTDQSGVKEIEEALRLRDARDVLQSKPAPDAIVIDTSDLSLEEVVAYILKQVRA